MAKGYSPQQIVRHLREAEGKLANGSTIPEVAREMGRELLEAHRQYLPNFFSTPEHSL